MPMKAPARAPMPAGHACCQAGKCFVRTVTSSNGNAIAAPPAHPAPALATGLAPFAPFVLPAPVARTSHDPPRYLALSTLLI